MPAVAAKKNFKDPPRDSYTNFTASAVLLLDTLTTNDATDTHAYHHANSNSCLSADAVPERRLLYAVLQDAVATAFYGARSESTSRPHLREGPQGEAWDWLLSDSREGLFSFLTVCEILELEPSAFRRDFQALYKRVMALARAKGKDGEKKKSSPRKFYVKYFYRQRF